MLTDPYDRDVGNGADATVAREHQDRAAGRRGGEIEARLERRRRRCTGLEMA
ncbi:MAG: hypothetical protein LC799_29170 [Actinobacteria bacterium]|nr:hypothetical protein [Actinomycetota bacterium]